MLTIQEFTEEVVSNLSQRGIKSRPSVVIKNNDVKRTGINIVNDTSKACPVVYLDEIYDIYKSGKYTVENAVEKVLEIIENADCLQYGDIINDILNFESCRDKVVVNMINKKNNTKNLENKVYRDFLDLALVYKIMLETSDDVTSTITVTKDIMESWEVTEDELFEIAMKNTEKMLPIFCKDMADLTEDIVRRVVGPEEYKELPNGLMYVVSNKSFNNGAVSILYKDCLKKLADKLETDLVLIPSSIHEIIIINPAEEPVDLEYLNSMISYVNSTQSKVNILSDHCYFYKRDTDEIVM